MAYLFSALIIMAQQLGYAMSSFFTGVYLDNKNMKPIFAIGMFLTGFFNFGFSGGYLLISTT